MTLLDARTTSPLALTLTILSAAAACAAPTSGGDRIEAQTITVTTHALGSFDVELVGADGTSSERVYDFETPYGAYELTIGILTDLVALDVRTEGENVLHAQLEQDRFALANAAGEGVEISGYNVDLGEEEATMFDPVALALISPPVLLALASDEDREPMVAGQREALISGGTTLSAMCCERYDPDSGTGSDCAFLAPGRTCDGDIMTCPGGCEHINTSTGTGTCGPCETPTTTYDRYFSTSTTYVRR